MLPASLPCSSPSRLAACSFQNKIRARSRPNHPRRDERRPAAGLGRHRQRRRRFTRVKVAEWSDELGAQGKLLSLKETPENCEPGWHCFEVKFEKHVYLEHMRLDEQRQSRRLEVSRWRRPQPGRSRGPSLDGRLRDVRAAAQRLHRGRGAPDAGRAVADARRRLRLPRSSSSARIFSAWARSSFAARITFWHLSRRPNATAGVVAFSSGNHAQGRRV